MLIPIEFTSAQRLVEKEKFEELLIITTQTTFFILITMHIFQHTSRLENENVYKWYQLKLRTDPDWTYDRAVIILTHVEIDILGHELNVTLASTISNQYNRQSDHYAASSLKYEERVNLIRQSRKGSRNQYNPQSMAEIYQERRRNEDSNPAPRMNQYGSQ